MNSSSAKHLFLAGFAGSGKTTVGRKLARLLKRPFFDLDRQIEKSQRMSVSEIFRDLGEQGFRQKESSELNRLCRTITKPSVIALGGGTLIATQNRRVVRTYGLTIYLRCNQHVLLQRLAGSRNRPLLQTDLSTKRRLAAVIRRLILSRRESYEACDFTISASKLTPVQIARKVRQAVA